MNPAKTRTPAKVTHPTGAFTAQSALLAPLNEVLGTETNVRIIRALTEFEGPISVSDLAHHISMSRAGVWRAVAALQEIGVVESVGTGTQIIQRRKAYPLSHNLQDLFHAERSRFRGIVEKLAEATGILEPQPKSVWLESPKPSRNQITDPIVVCLLANSSDVGRLADDFSRKITHIEKKFDIPLEVRGLTIADLAVRDLEGLRSLGDIVLVAGAPPTVFISNPPLGNEWRLRSATMHKDREYQSLVLARAVSEKIRRDPSIVRKAVSYLNRRLESASPREAKELQEWRRILQTYSKLRLRKFLTDGSERAVRLRQSSPFVGVISQTERAELLKNIANAE